jgi:hypothetical protein
VYYGKCLFCAEEVTSTDSRSVVREVSGWEPVRSHGGANHVINRKPSGRVAHKTCLDEKLIRVPGQGGLFT